MNSQSIFTQDESIYARVNHCKSKPDVIREEDRKESEQRCIHRNWFEVKDKLREKFAMLSEDDVQPEPGKEYEMMRAIERKLNLSPAKLQEVISYL